MDVRILRPKEIDLNADAQHFYVRERFNQRAEYEKVRTVDVNLDKVNIIYSALTQELWDNYGVTWICQWLGVCLRPL